MVNDYILKILNYEHKTLIYLKSAYEINEDRIFGDMNELKFKVPYYQYNGYGELLLNNLNEPIQNYSLQFLKNENLIDLNNTMYVIKNITVIRDNNNTKYYSVECIEKAIELSYKEIPILDLSPSVADPTRVDAIINNVLSAKFEIRSDTIQSSTINSITLDTGASAVDDYYNNMYIAIIGGTGQGQTFRILDYVGSTKVATIPTQSSITLDSTSIYRVHTSTWICGDVDEIFLESGGVDIKRYFKFENNTISECLFDIAERFNGYLTFNSVYDEIYNEFINTVGLAKPNLYDNKEIRYNKNLNSSNKNIDSETQIYTRLFPYGDATLTINAIATKTRTDSGVTYNTHTLGQSYIENFQYYLSLGYDIDFCRKTFLNDKIINNDLYIDEDDLYNYGEELLDILSLPKITYRISYVDLKKVKDIDYEDINEGDTIRVVDEELGITIYTTLIKKPIRWDSMQSSTIQLENSFNNLGDYFNIVIDKIQQL